MATKSSDPAGRHDGLEAAIRPRHSTRGERVALAVVLSLAACSLFPASTLAEKPTPSLVVRLPLPRDSAWQPLRFRSIKEQTAYTVGSDADGSPVFRAASECGASAMLLALPEDLRLSETPRLAWRWRIEKGLDVREERSEDGDDFAARVYVLFRFDRDRASRWQRLEHSLGRRFFGVDPPGETLTYVWASREPIGVTWTSAIRKEASLIVLESDSASSEGAWREASVDLLADAARVFNPAPRLEPYALGIMTDADGTCGHAVAEFADFRLLGPAAASDPKPDSKIKSPRANGEIP